MRPSAVHKARDFRNFLKGFWRRVHGKTGEYAVFQAFFQVSLVEGKLSSG